MTARRASLQPVTETALELLAPGAVDKVICTTWFDEHGHKHKRSKTDVCVEIGAREIIDDNLNTCIDVGRVSVEALLFGDYGWYAPDMTLPDHVTPTKNWQEVMDYFGLPVLIAGAPNTPSDC